MKRNIVYLLVWTFAFALIGFFSIKLSEAQQQPNQLQVALAEIAKQKIIIDDTKADRDALVLFIAELKKQTVIQNQGIAKANRILQKGYNNGKLNYEELRILGFEIVVDTANVYQRPKPDKPKKR